jgi:large subunit ribosomal protein L29
MKTRDVRQLSDEELQAELERLHRHLFDLRAQAVTEKLEDPTMLSKTRRDIARVLTIQHERERAAGGEQGQ